jgi:hypothetical protein
MRLRTILTLAAIFCTAILTGCQTETADSDLPAPRLSAPVIGAPASPAPRYTAVAPKTPHGGALIPPRPAPAVGGVPAGWIPPVAANKWNWIIIHHSDSDYGSAAIIDQWHRARGFDELGYHFVIGNGTNSGDGQIEVGPRWTKQKWGAHDNALDNRYNTNGIGICLVGNFDKYHPTAAQQQSLIRLTAYLMKTYNVPADRVLGHGQTKTTDCPGRYLSVAQIRASAAQIVAQGADPFNQRVANLR